MQVAWVRSPVRELGKCAGRGGGSEEVGRAMGQLGLEGADRGRGESVCGQRGRSVNHLLPVFLSESFPSSI